MPEQYLSQNQELRQEQILAPQQIQSLEVLLTPLLELQEKINRELDQNPVLELSATVNEAPAGDPLEDAHAASEAQTPDIDDDEGLSALLRMADNWHETLPLHNYNNSPENDEKREFLLNSLIEQTSLQEQLLDELRMTDVSPVIKRIAETIIGNIDNTGYIQTPLEDIAASAGASLAQTEKALTLIQQFDPPGIGARTLKECLLLQLRRNKGENRQLSQMLENHLEDIAGNRLPAIAKEMKISIDEVKTLIAEIKRLNPYPGSAAAPSNPIFVVPEVNIRKINDNFVVIPEKDRIPRLQISETYLKLLEDPNTPQETREYIRQKLNSGKMLIRSLEQRQSTILKIAQAIVDTQQDFLENGIEHLRPLTMQTVAEKLELHETTISRAIANKYIATPSGIFEFKFFFTGGYQSDLGEEVSSRAIKEKIREIIMKEDPDKPHSDSKISKMLKNDGFTVARRTVAKYREQLNLAPSHLRKEF